MLWELELRVLDKSAMLLQAYRLRPTGLCIQTNKPRLQAALTLSVSFRFASRAEQPDTRRPPARPCPAPAALRSLQWAWDPSESIWANLALGLGTHLGQFVYINLALGFGTPVSQFEPIWPLRLGRQWAHLALGLGTPVGQFESIWPLGLGTQWINLSQFSPWAWDPSGLVTPVGHLSIYPSSHLCIYASIHLPIYPSIHPSIYLLSFIYLSV